MLWRILWLGLCLNLSLSALAACETANDAEETTGETSETMEELPDSMPDDFDFALQYGFRANNELNTFENTYTKDLAADGDATTELELTEDEKETIYEEMKNVDILNAPNYVSEQSCVEPYEENHLSMNVEGKSIEKEWISAMCDETDEKLDAFIQFVHQEMIEPRDEYQALPEPTGGYD